MPSSEPRDAQSARPVHRMEPQSPRSGKRWNFLDSLRGFAVAGILLVNALDITKVGLGNDFVPQDPARDFLYLAVQTRFVPIFVFLFGMSLVFVDRSARARSRSSWLVLARRLIVIALIGALLGLIYPGNILIEYGMFGALVVPIVLYAPRWLILALGVASSATLYALGWPTEAGVMLLGAAAATYGIPAQLEHAGRPVAVTFVIATLVAVPAVLWQLAEFGDPRFTVSGIVAGVIMAVVYVTGLALLWRTPVRRVLVFIFEPLGRLALTNYVTGAAFFAIAALFADYGHMTQVWPVLAMSVGVLAAQSLLGRAWLRVFSYGPVEWLLRVATWARPVPLLRRHD